MPRRGESAEPTAADLARAVRAEFDTVSAHLERLRNEFTRSYQGRSLHEEDLAAAKEEALATLPGLTHAIGIGFVVAPDVICGQQSFLLWFQRHADRIGRLRLNLDPSDVDVYNYHVMDWYRLARDEGRRVAYGPYVDYSGSDHVTITLSLPMVVGGAFLGVVGADLSLVTLERRWIATLRSSSLDAVLVNSERRVVVTNATRWVISERLRSAPRAGDGTFVDAAELTDGTGWRVCLAIPTAETP